MPDHCDVRPPGTRFFFTVRLAAHAGPLLTDHFPAFGEAVRQARNRQPFEVDAWIVLPDHVHAIWTLPPGDHDCTGRWRAVKIAFSKALRKAGVDARSVWAPHYQVYRLTGEQDYTILRDYLHLDALKHGYAAEAGDWPWSSLHRAGAAGAPDAPPVPPWRARASP